jgi:hypothetical protein
MKHNKNALNNNKQTPRNIKHELISLLNTILEQNYLQLNEEYYKWNDGLVIDR